MLYLSFLNNIWTNINNSIMLSIIDLIKWICLYTCILSIILYSCGFKKAGIWSTASFVIYFISQCCKCGLK